MACRAKARSERATKHLVVMRAEVTGCHEVLPQVELCEVCIGVLC